MEHVVELRGGLVDGGHHDLVSLFCERAESFQQRESTAAVQARRGLLGKEGGVMEVRR